MVLFCNAFIFEEYTTTNHETLTDSLKLFSDNDLMLKVRSGELQYMGQLYERYKQWLFNFFLQMNRDRELSEDLVQNVFMRIMKYRHTYTDDSKFVTWMFQIARNAQSEHFRRNAKQNLNSQLDEFTYRMESPENYEKDMDKRDSHHTLQKALQLLPEEKREVLVLSKLKEMKYKEVGEALNCSEEAARTKAHRALKELRTIYMDIQDQ